MKRILIMVLAFSLGFTALHAVTWGTLTIAKSASIVNPAAGVNYTYVMAITSTVGNSVGVILSDTLPTLFSFQGSSPAATVTNGILSWSVGGMVTNSAQDFTFWGNIPVYVTSTIANIGEVFGTPGGDAKSTTILAMATSTFTLTSTKSSTPNWTPTCTPTFTLTHTGPVLTATANKANVNFTRTAVAVIATGTAGVNATATKAAQVTATYIANLTPNAVNTVAAETATQSKVNELATVNAQLTATATYHTGYIAKATLTATYAKAGKTATAAAIITATVGAKKTETAVYFLTKTKTFTPTITKTWTATGTPTFTVTVTLTPTATHNPSLPWAIPTLGAVNIAQGDLRVNFIQSTAWTTTSTAVNFYNATSPTGCIAGNILMTIQPSGAVTVPTTLYTAPMDGNGIYRGIEFSQGLYVSGTASGASIIIYTAPAKIPY